MKRKGTAVFAVLCGIVCALLVFTYANDVQREASAQRAEALARYGGDQVEVCVATKDLAPGETVNASNTVMKLWLTDLLPSGAISSFNSISGKRVTSSVFAGEVLCEGRFDEAAASIIVPSGMQAVSIELDAAQAIGGALQSGAQVNVYAVGASGASLIVSPATVVAAGSGSGSRRWVTLAVEPSSVQEIIAATQTSSLYLTLPAQEERSSDA